MVEVIEGLEPQKTPEVIGEKVELSKAELEDLKHKAEVSSQNFERAKKAELEAKELKVLLEKQNNEVPSIVDEDLGSLRSELKEVKEKQAKLELQETYPQLKEVWNLFEEFRSQDENKGLNLKTAAKAFLVEKELIAPQRKGLERTTGGPKAPVSAGMSPEDVKGLRENNYKKYLEMVRKGQLKIS